MVRLLQGDSCFGIALAFCTTALHCKDLAQSYNAAQILDDLEGPMPMVRLLQGDVGSGKTAVAFLALLAAVGSGWQGAMMAPTEVGASLAYSRKKSTP